MYLYCKIVLLIICVGIFSACGEHDMHDHSDHHAGEDSECTNGSMQGDEALLVSQHSLTFTVTELSPSSLSNGLNQMTIMVSDETGVMMSVGALKLTPFMPKHGHGTSPADFIGEESDPGVYTFTDVNFIMPGLWELTLAWDTMEAQMSVCVAE